MAEKVNILNIKEIFYEHGKIKFRYSRYLSADGTKWIRHGFMNLTKMVIFFRQKIMKIFYFSSKKIENCVNIISSSLNRKQVRAIFSSDVQEIYKSSYSRVPMDVFPELNIHCFYDDKNQLEAIEIFEPNKFFLEDISFNWFGKSNDEIISYLYKSGIVELMILKLMIWVLGFLIFLFQL